MIDTTFRYQPHPLINDTVGFFKHCVPVSDLFQKPKHDSLKVYYDFSVFDYITPPPPKKEYQAVTSLFALHQLEPAALHSKPIEKQPVDWIVGVFIVCLGILAWIRTNHQKRFEQIFRALAQPHYLNQVERFGNIFGERIAPALLFVFFAITSLFIYLFSKEIGGLQSAYPNYVITAAIFVGLLVWQSAKAGLIFLLGNIFKTESAARIHLLNTLLFSILTGIVLFPFTFLAFYYQTRIMLLVAAGILALIVLFYFFRNIFTGIGSKPFNLFYLFLYLCTLEILPVLLLYKIITRA